MGLIAAALVVNGYFLWKNSSSTVPERAGVVAKKATSNSDKFKDAPGTKLETPEVKPIEKTPESNDPKTGITFAQMDHDFGQVDQNSENEYIFKFTNSGTNPLIIYKAKGSCGCTVPDYPKEPIAPGEDGEIKVVYKPGKQKNKQTKYVTVTANTEPTDTKLKITADVLVAEEQGS
ncbi:MAG: DUF1573 domain-containing protein [Flavobacteriales bacterium]|nr:DUF1573 domain-containing protein [Flavobacteriales bacterium]